jgi:hypothetical protein
MYKGFTIKFSNISIRLLLKKKKFSNIWWDLMDPSKDDVILEEESKTEP